MIINQHQHFAFVKLLKLTLNHRDFKLIFYINGVLLTKRLGVPESHEQT